MLRENKEDLTTWRDLLGLWFGRLSISKIYIFSKVIYGFTPILVKISESFFFFFNMQAVLKFIQNCKELKTAKKFCRRKLEDLTVRF